MTGLLGLLSRGDDASSEKPSSGLPEMLLRDGGGVLAGEDF